MLLSVVLSFKNEQDVIPEALSRLNKAMASIGDDYEYIFINDASTDRSLEILTERAKNDHHIKIVSTSRSFGHDECLYAGFQYSRGDAVVIFAADCQDPPEVIPELWSEFKKGADVVYTTRLSRPGESNLKLFVTKVGYWLLHRMTGVIPPDSGDFRMISRRVVNHILKIEERHPLIRGMTFWIGYKHKQVFYHRENRTAGHGHFPILSGAPARVFLHGVISYSRWPLHTMMLLGLAFGIVSLFAAAGLILYSVFIHAVEGWIIITDVLFFLSGIQLFFTGFAGLYAASTFDEVRKRPNYIVTDTFGFEKNSVREIERHPNFS